MDGDSNAPEIPGTAPITLNVRYFASARAAAGKEEEALALPAGSTVADAIGAVRDRHRDSLARILLAAGFLLDGTAVRSREITVHDGATLDVLPPFAGG